MKRVVEMGLTDEKPAMKIDVQGEICPYPLIETRNALKQLKKDDLLEVLTDSETSVNETIPQLCEKKGYRFEKIKQGSVWRVLIKKTAD